MVDPSLLRLAADRGVTICFADLDGADGLWVPEERTVLVNRRLSDREVAEVIEHELAHVAIDDQHADLDAGVGRPPGTRHRGWAAALTAAACLAVVGGVTVGLAKAPGTGIDQEPVVAPSAPGLTASAGGGPVVVRTDTRISVGPDGRTVVVTVTVPAPSLPLSSTPGGTAASTPPASKASPTRVLPPGPSPTVVEPSPTPEPTPSATAEPSPTESPTPTATPAGEPGDDTGGGSPAGVPVDVPIEIPTAAGETS